MPPGQPPRRLRGLTRKVVLDREVPVADGLRARLLGLSLIDRHRAGPGLLIPRCSNVHTIGMRFELDLVFLDRAGRPIGRVEALGPWRIVRCRGAEAVLELPSRAISCV